MKILPANKSVEFEIEYNRELNCIDFNVYPNDWIDDAWLKKAGCKKVVGEYSSRYYYQLDDCKRSHIYRFYSATFKFHKFTNTLKLSKTERAPFKFMEVLARPAAAQLFNEFEKLQRDLAKNQERANKLAEVVNNAVGWDDDLNKGQWKIVKEKYSTSKWYDRPDVANQHSHYLYLVPACVGKEAQELVSIRRQYQNNPNFNFYACDHYELELRVADHYNGSCADFDISFEYFDKLTDEGIIRY